MIASCTGGGDPIPLPTAPEEESMSTRTVESTIPSVCEDCGKTYPTTKTMIPVTDRPYTCDDVDCLGYVTPNGVVAAS